MPPAGEASAAPRAVERWSLFAAFALVAFYLASSLYISAHRLLWIDEVLTAMTTRLPGCTAIWRAFARGADGLPPTYFMLMRPFDALFRHSDFGLRVPSALAMIAGMLLTFDCARRLTNGLHGLIALSVLTCSFLPYYGHEARSYALYFMLAALALWIWSYDTKNRWPAAVAFGGVLLLALGTHYYAVLCLVPYAVLELANWKPGRPSRKLAAGSIAVLSAIAILWTPIEAGRRFYPANYLTRPSLEVLRTTFADLFPDSLLLLAIVVVWIALLAGKRRRAPLAPMQPAERLGWFFFLIPIAGYVLAQVAHAFQLRYLIAALPGIAVAFSCWLWRHFQRAAHVSLGVLLILAGWGLAKQVSAVRHPSPLLLACARDQRNGNRLAERGQALLRGFQSQPLSGGAVLFAASGPLRVFLPRLCRAARDAHPGAVLPDALLEIRRPEATRAGSSADHADIPHCRSGAASGYAGRYANLRGPGFRLSALTGRVDALTDIYSGRTRKRTNPPASGLRRGVRSDSAVTT
jgi:hypothetical protein